jgi:phosphate transport system protein
MPYFHSPNLVRSRNMTSNEHISKQFDAELEAVRARVLQMGGLVESQIRSAIAALNSGDVVLMNSVIDNDHRVNGMEVEIDEICNRVISRRQPVAGDLRLIVMVIKTITDLERIGDEAKKIARMAVLLSKKDHLAIPRYNEITHAAEIAIDMLRTSLDAFARLDISSTAQVVRQDKRVDEEFRATMRYLITFMMEDPRTISTALEILFVAKAIERIGDHAKNMAEYVVYMVKGRDVRHVTLEEVEREALG